MVIFRGKRRAGCPGRPAIAKASKAAVGFEPTYNGFANSKPSGANPCKSEDCDGAGIDLADCLAFLAANRPDLATVATAWDDLPEPVKAGILAMVKAAGLSAGD